MDWLVVCVMVMFCWYAAYNSVAYLLVIWFDDAKFFVEYGSKFGLRKIWPHFDAFLKAKEAGSDQSYLEFISIVKNNFWTRLVTCEKCLSPWISFGYLMFTMSIASLVVQDFRLLLAAPSMTLPVAFAALKEFNQTK